MQTIHIKTWTTSTQKGLHQFYILSKGHHAGRPMDKPCPNCFVVSCNNDQTRNMLYWLCYALWQSGMFRECLVGSVIEFLHIRDVKILLSNVFVSARQHPEKYLAFTNSLQGLLHYETCLNDQLIKIKKLKEAYASQMLRWS